MWKIRIGFKVKKLHELYFLINLIFCNAGNFLRIFLFLSHERLERVKIISFFIFHRAMSFFFFVFFHATIDNKKNRK